MNFIDIIILICVVLIIGLIIFFNIKSMKNGENKCTKCPYAKDCNKNIKCGTSKNKEETNKTE